MRPRGRRPCRARWPAARAYDQTSLLAPGWHYKASDDSSKTATSGKEADLLLLNANPLSDTSAIRDMAGVMLGGVWLPRSEMRAILDDIVAGYEISTAIELEPYADADLGISGVAPAGWTEIDAGVLTRSDPESDPTFLIPLVAPAEAADGLMGSVLENFGIAEPGEPARN